MTKATLASLFALAVSASALACSPEVPANPTYTKDVQPIFAAHCVRCHDETFEPMLDSITGMEKIPLVCHLNRYENVGDSQGASSPTCVGFSLMYTQSDDPRVRMPKPPSEPLNEWEKEVIKRWAATNPPAP